MALDGGFLYCLRQELWEALPDARVDKIHQPGREELILSLRTRGGVFKLYLSTQAASPRVHFTEQALDNPLSPPMFCMLLRKRLTGGRLLDIRQEGLERALYFDFDCINELGDHVTLTLAIEMMGRHSNLILIDEQGKIVDAVKRIGLEQSSVRPVLPGLSYEVPPQTAGRTDLLLRDTAALLEAVRRGRDDELSSALLGCSQGLSPLVCREIAHLTTRGAERRVSELTEEEWQRLTFYTERVRQTLLTGERRVPYLLRKPDGEPTEFSYMPITQYGLSVVGEQLPGFSALLDTFYADRDRVQRTRRRAHDTLKVIVNAYDRTARKLAHQRQELQQSGERDTFRLYGDLLMASAHTVPRGAARAQLINYYDEAGGNLTVPLDPALTATQNAQKYYKLYRKAQTAERVLTEQITAGGQELLYLDSVLDALSRADTLRELAEVRQELLVGGYLRGGNKRQKPAPPLGPMTFTSADGFRILVGRNNVENDRLTLKLAQKADIWLHTKDCPGSHTVIVTEGRTPPDSTVREAAAIAAAHSKAADSAQVPVDFTQIRYVKKPAGAKPGMVIYDHQQTVYVTPKR